MAKFLSEDGLKTLWKQIIKTFASRQETATLANRVSTIEENYVAVDDTDSEEYTRASFNNTVYCWGDSLTQGIGGNVNGWHLISYPQILSERCHCVNLGILSDNVLTIQARQGSVQILLPACTIPGDSTQGVEIGEVDDGLSTDDTMAETAKLLKYGEAGINPCYVNGVPCVLYRSYLTDTQKGTKFYLRRLENGDAVDVGKNTPLITYAAKHYKGGIHIFWFGANGGYGNITSKGNTDLRFDDYVARLSNCIYFAQPKNYLIVYARERVGYTDHETEEKRMLKERFGEEHVIDLMPQMRDRGLLYGETSVWDGSLVKGNPSILDSGDGCHYNFYGYRAIANILWERLYPLLKADAIPLGDQFGTWIYKMPKPTIFTAESLPINTGFQPFKAGHTQWTVAINIKKDIGACNGLVRPLWMQQRNSDNTKNVTLGVYDSGNGFEMPKFYFLVGPGGFKLDPASMNITLSEGNYHTIILARDGNKFYNFIDGNLIYNNALDYSVEVDSLRTLQIGGDGYLPQMIGEINDVRIYDKCLSIEDCTKLMDIMQKEASA